MNRACQMRSVIRRWPAVVCLITAAACGSDSTTAPAPRAETFNLVTVNGGALPYVFQTANGPVSLLADAYTLNPDGTYLEQGSEQSTTSTGVSTTDGSESGTWAVAGTSAVFVPANQIAGYPGFLSGDTLSFAEGTLLLIYVHQR